MKHKLVRFKDVGEDCAFLRYKSSLYGDENKRAVPFNRGEASTVTAYKELADFLDQDAESCNAHDFVGCHRLLAVILSKNMGMQMAADILYDIAELGGLHGMNGVCGKQDAFKELGIKEPWKDWEL